jgi:hypothetical protein
MDARAAALISELAVSFEKCLIKQEEDDEESEWVYATCLNALAISLSIVLAGSGDLKAFKLLRRLRKRSGPSLRKYRYGTHMAMHMAIGFLFLGGGCQSFGTSNLAIAALLCAIYPRFPQDVDDNQYHMQAMRHLYVLAVEPRCVEARDVETDSPCYVPLLVKLKDDANADVKLINAAAPCLLPDARYIESISVVSERYLPKSVGIPEVKGDGGWFSGTKRLVIYVKRRAGHLPQAVDPSGAKGMLARSFGRLRSGAQAQISLAHLVRAFSADLNMLTFVRHFCDSNVNDREALRKFEFFGETLYECLSLDKPEAVQTYLEIDRALESLTIARLPSGTIGSLVLLGEYASCSQLQQTQTLIRQEYMWTAAAKARKLLAAECLSALAAYAESEGRTWPGSSATCADRAESAAMLGRTLQLYRIPCPRQLKGLLSPAPRRSIRPDDIWLNIGSSLDGNVPDCAITGLAKALARCNGFS